MSEETGWRPIETLSSDDTVLVSNGEMVWSDSLIPLNGDYRHIVWDIWSEAEGDPAPTHWMPLPAPPKVHASDCAVHNAPALPVGPCDCGAS